MKLETNHRNRFASLICLALCAHSVVAQTSNTVRLSGTVVDSEGAAISQVQITVSNSTASYHTVSNEEGKFSINLPAGTYQLRSAEVPGFAATNRDLVLESGKNTGVTIVPTISISGGDTVWAEPRDKIIAVCPIEYSAAGKTAGWHSNLTFTVVSGIDGKVVKVSDLRSDMVQFVNQGALVECIKTFKLSPAGAYVVRFSIGTTGDGNYISIVAPDGDVIKLVLP